MFNLDFSVRALLGDPQTSIIWLTDKNGLTEKYRNWNYCGNKDTYILDALEVS